MHLLLKRLNENKHMTTAQLRAPTIHRPDGFGDGSPHGHQEWQGLNGDVIDYSPADILEDARQLMDDPDQHDGLRQCMAAYLAEIARQEPDKDKAYTLATETLRVSDQEHQDGLLMALLGEVYAEQAEPLQAERCYKEALQSDDMEHVAVLGLSRLYREQARDVHSRHDSSLPNMKAVTLNAKASKLLLGYRKRILKSDDPVSPHSQWELADELVSAGTKRKARKLYQRTGRDATAFEDVSAVELNERASQASELFGSRYGYELREAALHRAAYNLKQNKERNEEKLSKAAKGTMEVAGLHRHLSIDANDMVVDDEAHRGAGRHGYSVNPGEVRETDSPELEVYERAEQAYLAGDNVIAYDLATRFLESLDGSKLPKRYIASVHLAEAIQSFVAQNEKVILVRGLGAGKEKLSK